MPPHKQNRNWALEQQLMAAYQSRREAQFYWKSAVSTLLALPALRAAWPMSSVGYQAADQARDVSGAGNHLTNTPSVDFSYDVLIPYSDYNAASYLLRTDAAAPSWANIRGNEPYISPAQRGLTLGGWFWRDVQAAQGLICKYINGPAAYLIFNTGVNDIIRFVIWDVVPVQFTVDGTSGGTGRWECWIGRYTPSTEVAIFGNGTKTTNVVGIPALIRDTAADFGIGAYGNPVGNELDGRASLCFLCAAALSDVTVSQFYHQTRIMFGHV